jgi:hypothetical protein
MLWGKLQMLCKNTDAYEYCQELCRLYATFRDGWQHPFHWNLCKMWSFRMTHIDIWMKPRICEYKWHGSDPAKHPLRDKGYFNTDGDAIVGMRWPSDGEAGAGPSACKAAGRATFNFSVQLDWNQYPKRFELSYPVELQYPYSTDWQATGAYCGVWFDLPVPEDLEIKVRLYNLECCCSKYRSNKFCEHTIEGARAKHRQAFRASMDEISRHH